MLVWQSGIAVVCVYLGKHLRYTKGLLDLHGHLILRLFAFLHVFLALGFLQKGLM